MNLTARVYDDRWKDVKWHPVQCQVRWLQSGTDKEVFDDNLGVIFHISP